MADRGAVLRRTLWTWSGGVGLAIFAGSGWAIAHGSGDWRVFASAGRLAGTPALLHPPEAWQIFAYLPGAALLLVPFAGLSVPAGFVLAGAIMLACAAAAGAVAAALYDIPRGPAAALYALWPPVVYAAAIIGQNAPLGLLLAQLTIAGIATGSSALTGFALGALLYKPTYALPLLVVALILGRVRALAVTAACAGAWYLAGMVATGGDAAWPIAWLQLLVRYAPGDLRVNAMNAVSLPGVLAAAGLGAPVIVTVSLAAAAAAFAALRRSPPLEAASLACLAGLALSPHAWAYDAALALPALAYGAGRLQEPVRTRAVLAAFIVAPLFFLAPLLHVDPLALAVIGASAAWVAFRLRRPAHAR